MELLQGKTAIAPGGTRGIGLAVVRVFLQNGARVALFGSRQETADRLSPHSSPRSPAGM